MNQTSPVICFGQQPCGFFPKRFLVAKILTALRLRDELGGRIVFFYHDSDHDSRETKTILHHRKNDEIAQMNFTYENKTQRKYSPLYAKRISADWHAKTVRQLPAYVDPDFVEVFKKQTSNNVADFCLDMYRDMELLKDIEVVRSSDPVFRKEACEISDFFVDVKRDGEIVRARYMDGALKLHEGGDVYVDVPLEEFSKEQLSPTRDSRLKWMQSVIHCTHYVAGAGEQDYLRKDDAPEIEFVTRDTIEKSDEAYIEHF